MAYARYGQHDKSFICDAVEDLQNLPFATIGSTCYVIANASKYIVNSKGEWIRQTYGDIPSSESGGANIDLSNYATIKYVDQKFDEIDLSNYATINYVNEEIDTLEAATDVKIEQIREEANLDDAVFEGGVI